MVRAIWAVALFLTFAISGFAQDPAVSMDEDAHYSRVFSNDFCRVYTLELGRLEQTKPIVHEHDWVRMTLAGIVEQAWSGSVFSSAGYEDPDGYYIAFLFPVDRLILRNPRSDPYRALIVEIMQSDDSRNQMNDPSLNSLSRTLGPGVDPHTSYVTSLKKTSVEIVNVQLVRDDAREFRSNGRGILFVAMTDLYLRREAKEGGPSRLELGKGDIKWLPDGSATFRNEGKDPARFVLLEM